MSSLPFHVSGQEWRYSPREKSLTQTLHLAELPIGVTTDGIAIPVLQDPNKDKFRSFGVPPLQLPAAPSLSATVFNTYLQSVDSPCYACVSSTQVITAQKQCAVTIDSWTSSLMQITFNPALGGRFLVHIEGQSDTRNGTYQGPNSDGLFTLESLADGSASISAQSKLLQVNMSSATKELVGILHAAATGLVSIAGSFVAKGINNGDPSGSPPANLSAFILMIDAHA